MRPGSDFDDVSSLEAGGGAARSGAGCCAAPFAESPELGVSTVPSGRRLCRFQVGLRGGGSAPCPQQVDRDNNMVAAGTTMSSLDNYTNAGGNDVFLMSLEALLQYFLCRRCSTCRGLHGTPLEA